MHTEKNRSTCVFVTQNLMNVGHHFLCLRLCMRLLVLLWLQHRGKTNGWAAMVIWAIMQLFPILPLLLKFLCLNRTRSTSVSQNLMNLGHFLRFCLLLLLLWLQCWRESHDLHYITAEQERSKWLDTYRHFVSLPSTSAALHYLFWKRENNRAWTQLGCPLCLCSHCLCLCSRWSSRHQKYYHWP